MTAEVSPHAINRPSQRRRVEDLLAIGPSGWSLPSVVSLLLTRAHRSVAKAAVASFGCVVRHPFCRDRFGYEASLKSMTAYGIRLFPVLALLFAGCNLYIADDDHHGDGPASGFTDGGFSESDASSHYQDAGSTDADPWDSDGGVGSDGGTSSCSDIVDEFTCVSAGCGTVYNGDGCACAQTGECSCVEYLFVACKSP